MAISLLNETGVVVVAVTCDNPSCNWKMMENLGANLSNADHLKVTLRLNNVIHVPILVIFDVGHLLKLVRNCVGDFKSFFSGSGHPINWNYIVALHEIQSKNGLHAANRLRSKHIDYKSNKMKTSYAAQTFSKSVASGVRYCNHQKYPEFEGSEETAHFVNLLNDMFDQLNQKSKYGKHLKAPLCEKNFHVWSSNFVDYTNYIKTLKHSNGKAVICKSITIITLELIQKLNIVRIISSYQNKLVFTQWLLLSSCSGKSESRIYWIFSCYEKLQV